MSELIDLTLTLGGNRITAVPGLVSVEMEPLMTHQSHARSNTKLTLATHVGTHVDAPYHFHPGGITVDDMPLERYMGPSLLLDLRKLARRGAPISVANLQQAGGGEEALRDMIAVLFTSWAERESGGERFYTAGPYLSDEGAGYLAQCAVNAVAVDFPIDKHPATAPSTIHDFPVHRLLLGQGIPLIENLINLDRLVGQTFELWALPIKLQGGDGAAARAVARIL
jgi:kynurenine formamidase